MRTQGEPARERAQSTVAPAGFEYKGRFLSQTAPSDALRIGPAGGREAASRGRGSSGAQVPELTRKLRGAAVEQAHAHDAHAVGHDPCPPADSYTLRRLCVSFVSSGIATPGCP